MEDKIGQLVKALWALEYDLRRLREFLAEPPEWLVSPKIEESQAGEEEEEEEEE